jgi:exosome complex protein LRP1
MRGWHGGASAGLAATARPATFLWLAHATVAQCRIVALSHYRTTTTATMDPQTDLPDLVEDLEVNIDELTTALEPLLATPLHATASSLPLLDKAEFYCMSAYAVEAILFSVLKASGVDAAQHDVFNEIARLKQYNSKIKHIKDRAITGSAEGRARLDVGAAQRFIKHGLSGNDKYDLERQERMAREKARAHLKAQNINKKFDSEGNPIGPNDATPSKRAVDDVDAREDNSDSHVLDGLAEAEPAAKKARVEAADAMDIDSASASASSSQASAKKQKKKAKKEKTKKKETRASKTKINNEANKAEDKATQSAESTYTDADTHEDEMSQPPIAAADSQQEPVPDTDTPQPKKRGRPPKRENRTTKTKQEADTISLATDAQATPSRAEDRVTRTRNKRLSTQNSQEEEVVVPTPDRAPKTRSETFSALLDGSLDDKQKKGAGGGRGNKKGGRGRAK